MLIETYTFGPLRVLLDAETGIILAVQDKLTGCAASLLYSQASIRSAEASARLAWASLAELA